MVVLAEERGFVVLAEGWGLFLVSSEKRGMLKLLWMVSGLSWGFLSELREKPSPKNPKVSSQTCAGPPIVLDDSPT